jgi:hypothetical protein
MFFTHGRRTLDDVPAVVSFSGDQPEPFTGILVFAELRLEALLLFGRGFVGLPPPSFRSLRPLTCERGAPSYSNFARKPSRPNDRIFSRDSCAKRKVTQPLRESFSFDSDYRKEKNHALFGSWEIHRHIDITIMPFSHSF